jgi:hypothetical protein
VGTEWERFASARQEALGLLVEGWSEPFKALWSNADGAVIIWAFTGYGRGWGQVSARLDRAAEVIRATDRAAENVVTVVGDDLAYTVDLEHMTVTSVTARTPGSFAAPRSTAGKTASGRSCCATPRSSPRKNEQQRRRRTGGSADPSVSHFPAARRHANRTVIQPM